MKSESTPQLIDFIPLVLGNCSVGKVSVMQAWGSEFWPLEQGMCIYTFNFSLRMGEG